MTYIFRVPKQRFLCSLNLTTDLFIAKAIFWEIAAPILKRHGVQEIDLNEHLTHPNLAPEKINEILELEMCVVISPILSIYLNTTKSKMSHERNIDLYNKNMRKGITAALLFSHGGEEEFYIDTGFGINRTSVSFNEYTRHIDRRSGLDKILSEIISCKEKLIPRPHSSRKIKAQEWVDENDGKYDILMIRSCNPHNVCLESKKSLLYYPKGLSSIYKFANDIDYELFDPESAGMKVREILSQKPASEMTSVMI
ncbi:MAG TPA: hypothetical protein VJI75_00990 [Candidatus Nanoarchaeia archaeon]|nr:hypothetical protein [Candidatus Nanoarchaeia archaeon]